MRPNTLPRFQRKARQWLNRYKVRGLQLYKGASTMPGQGRSGAQVMALLTLNSENAKLGREFQTWHLRADMHPTDARRGGAGDGPICGEGKRGCPFRAQAGQKLGACYPDGRGLVSLWSSYKRGNYPDVRAMAADIMPGTWPEARKLETALNVLGTLPDGIRLGAYGDPAAMPFEIAEQMTNISLGHTGYTHQASRKFFDKRFLTLCQVSADTPKQALKFQAMGAKTFRVALEGDALMDNEIECLSDSKNINCLDCGLCNGIKQNIAITVHGTWSSNFKSARVAA